MQCEVCGRQILGKPYKTIIEGVNMIVCSRCAQLGSGRWKTSPNTRKKKTIKPQLTRPTIKKQHTIITDTLELVNDFGLLIRRAREEMSLSHEDLGRKIGEKVSVLRRIETSKVTPDLSLVKKLEHTLKIKLLVPSLEPKVPSSVLSRPRGVTLRDMVRLKERKTEGVKERKRS